MSLLPIGGRYHLRIGPATCPARIDLAGIARRVSGTGASIDTVEKLPCDIRFALHLAFSGMAEKLKKQAADPKSNPFIDTSACRVFADSAQAARGADRGRKK